MVTLEDGTRKAVDRQFARSMQDSLALRAWKGFDHADILPKSESSGQMKALTVLQPWAWAIIHGPKRIENRTWFTRYRGPLAIHAGVSHARLGDEGELLPGMPPYCELVYGAIIGTVDLVDCVRLVDVAGRPFATGPWCWIIERPQALARPIPFRGRQGLYDIPDELLAAA